MVECIYSTYILHDGLLEDIVSDTFFKSTNIICVYLVLTFIFQTTYNHTISCYFKVNPWLVNSFRHIFMYGTVSLNQVHTKKLEANVF